MALLAVSGLTVRFGGLTAVDDLTFQVAPGEIHGLIGPNGAGKSTVFNCLSRFYQPAGGAITFDGQDVLRLRPHQIVGAGIARTFQNVELFRGMTVLENVMTGQHHTFAGSFWHDLWPFGRAYQTERARRERARQVLTYLGLADVAGQYVGGLAYGRQKMVELARALVSEPKLLLLDEPAAGLNPQETHQLGEFIRDLRTRLHLTILLVEHDMSLVMRICEQITVMDFGKKIAAGSPREVQADPAVIKAYLGEEEAGA